jgi:Family of unknown function (DUF5329)
MRLIVIFCSFLAWLVTHAAPLAAPMPAPARADVEAILKALQSSGCQFNRNGSWYTGSEAQAHLTKKLDYLESKDLVKSAEDFITIGASTSSLSGKPYLVRCMNGPAIESQTWLQDKLKAIRDLKR